MEFANANKVHRKSGGSPSNDLSLYQTAGFGQHIKLSLTLERLGRLSNEGHGFSFSRVPMSLRLTQGDENHGERCFSTVPH